MFSKFDWAFQTWIIFSRAISLRIFSARSSRGYGRLQGRVQKQFIFTNVLDSKISRLKNNSESQFESKFNVAQRDIALGRVVFSLILSPFDSLYWKKRNSNIIFAVISVFYYIFFLFLFSYDSFLIKKLYKPATKFLVKIRFKYIWRPFQL